MKTQKRTNKIIKRFLKGKSVKHLIVKEPLIVQYYLVKAFSELKREKFLKFFSTNPQDREYLHPILNEVYDLKGNQNNVQAAQNGFGNIDEYINKFKQISNELTSKDFCKSVEKTI
jgi:hypothetical protein